MALSSRLENILMKCLIPEATADDAPLCFRCADEALTAEDFEQLIPSLAKAGIRQIQCANLPLGRIPLGMEVLENLSSLYLEECGITRISEGEAQSLNRLWNLTLQESKLSEFPVTLSDIPHLSTLSLIDVPAMEIPEEMPHFPFLDQLWVMDCNAPTVPAAFANLSHLWNLHWSGGLEEIPAAFFRLPNLLNLTVRGNFDCIPKEVREGKKLTKLAATKGRISSLPDEMGELENLNRISLGESCFEIFPEILCQMPQLQEIRLHNNQLSSLPDAVAQMPSLTTLGLSRNQFTEIPEILRELKTLQYLYFDANQIRELPDWIEQLNLIGFGFSGNPLASFAGDIEHRFNFDKYRQDCREIAEMEKQFPLLLAYIASRPDMRIHGTGSMGNESIYCRWWNGDRVQFIQGVRPDRFPDSPHIGVLFETQDDNEAVAYLRSQAPPLSPGQKASLK